MFSVIFDMDGTLLDTQKIYIEAWDNVGKRYGIADMGKHVPNVCGMNDIGCLSYLSNTFPSLDGVAFKREVAKYISENLEVRYMSGAKELLDFLRTNGIKIALASGTSRPSVEHHLNAVGAAEYFDAVVCGGDVEKGKPAPDIFLLAASLIGAEPSECYVFEDSENGIRAGYAAGMKCIGVADIVPFGDEVKKLMYAELSSLSEALEMFKNENSLL